MPKIERWIIDKVLEATSIVDVIGDFVKLRKAGVSRMVRRLMLLIIIRLMQSGGEIIQFKRIEGQLSDNGKNS